MIDADRGERMGWSNSRSRGALGLGPLIILLAGMTTQLVGCGEKAPTTVTPPPTKNFPAQEEAMYLRLVDTGKFLYTMSKRTDPSKECFINKTEPNKSITCDLRVSEMDLVMHPLSFEFNVPGGICEYLGVTPYSYYRWEPGLSAGYVEIDATAKDCNPNGTNDLEDVPSAWGCHYKDANGNFLFSVAYDGIITSPFDHTLNGGPNCAQGTVTAVISTTTTSGEPPTSTTTTNNYSTTFSGNYANCLGGPAIELMAWPLSEKGYPTEVITTMDENGINNKMEMKAITETQLSATIRLANGYNYQNTFRNGAKVYSSTPEVFYPKSAPRNANPLYQWRCYDQAREVKYEIKLVIHEFDTHSEFKKWYDSDRTDPSIADPDMLGRGEGSGCDHFDSEEYCDDSADWDDYGKLSSPYPEYN